MSLPLPTSSPATSSGIATSAPTSTLPTTSSAPSTPASTSTPTLTATTPSSTAASSSTPATSSLSSSNATTQSSSSALTTPSTTSSSTSATPTPMTVTSGGVVVTTFVTSPGSVSSTPSSANNAATTTSFFHNTGAVAGVFTVVGLIVLVIFIALVTNAVRRRRAQKFDRDVAEAAAEAAASSRSPFDDYPSGGKDGYPYSDSTHGTFGQAPMGLPNDAYGMSEMSRYDPYAAGERSLAAAPTVGRARTRQASESRAPGIAGVGAGNLTREPSRRTPYHAFAGPGPQVHETPSMRYRRGAEMLEAASLAGTGVAAMATPDGGAYINRRPSQFIQQTHGTMRSQGRQSNENYPQPLQPGYQSPPRNDTQFADAYTGYNGAPIPQRLPSPGPAFPIVHDVPQSFPSHSQNHLADGENFHDGPPPARLHEDERMSYADDDDYGQHNRVLRVANE